MDDLIKEDEPKRPEYIPKTAQYNKDENIWEVGEQTGKYGKVGKWCNYNNDGEIISITVYNKISKIITQENFTYDKTKYNEYLASKKAENKNQALIDKLDEFICTNKSESAEQAFGRYKKVVELLILEDEKEYACLKNSFTCKQSVSLEELENEEKRLKIKLPESYKLFVLKNGFISYGDARQMVFPLKTLSEALKDEFGLDDNTINKYYEDSYDPDNLVIFSTGDEGQQLEYYHCFRTDGIVYDFDQEDLGYERDLHNSFDEYMTWATNVFIEDEKDTLEQEI